MEEEEEEGVESRYDWNSALSARLRFQPFLSNTVLVLVRMTASSTGGQQQASLEDATTTRRRDYYYYYYYYYYYCR